MKPFRYAATLALACGNARSLQPESAADAAPVGESDDAPSGTWRLEILESGTSVDLRAAWVAPDGVLWIAGVEGVVRRLDQDGWHAATVGLPAGLSLRSLGGDTALIAGGRSEVWSWDGATWSREVSLRCFYEVASVQAFADATALAACNQAVGRFVLGDPASLELTGLDIAPGLPPRFGEGIAALGPAVYVVGDGVARYRGGAWDDARSWSREANGSWRSVWGVSGDEVTTVGDGGAILRWDGATWTAEDGGATSTLHAVWGSDRDGWFAVGGGGAVLHRDALVWSRLEVEIEGAPVLRAVHGRPGGPIYIVGNGGVVIRAIR